MIWHGIHLGDLADAALHGGLILAAQLLWIWHRHGWRQ
jgi:hypothetical protein